MKKAFWQNLANEINYDHLNKEKFPSFKRTDYEDIVSVLTTGSIANLFYTDVTENIRGIVQTIKTFKDTDFLAKATIYARHYGFTRTIPILSLVEISRRNPKLFKEIAERVCLNPHDWQQFIDIARSGIIRKGIGRAIKTKIIDVIREMQVYHAIKYPKAVEDMINIARPNKRVNPTIINYIKRNAHEGDESLEALKIIKTSKNENEIIKAIKFGNLPYEVVTGSVHSMTPKIWEALLYRAPHFNLIRNLNNFIRNGVFENENNLNYAIRRITNREEIKRSKLFPFRYYIAYKTIKESNEYLDSVSEILNALEQAIEISVENIPKLNGKIAIAPDVSGSMWSKVTGDYSKLRCIDIVGIFAGSLIRKSKQQPIFLPFNHRIRNDLANKFLKKETICEMAETLEASGGTSLSAPIEWLIHTKEEVDYFIAFTDNEEWVGRKFLDAFLDYKKISPNCKAYLVTLLPYRDYPVPPNIKDVHFIFGWSDSVLRYITTNPKKQLEEIKNIKI